jgi:hypothetical protein
MNFCFHRRRIIRTRVPGLGRVRDTNAMVTYLAMVGLFNRSPELASVLQRMVWHDEAGRLFRCHGAPLIRDRKVRWRITVSAASRKCQFCGWVGGVSKLQVERV